MEFKSKNYAILIIAFILLACLSTLAYFQFFETKVESSQEAVQKDLDANVETLASVTKSTAILVFCVGIVGLLVFRGKRDRSSFLSLRDK